MSWAASAGATSYKIKQRDSPAAAYVDGSTTSDLTSDQILPYGVRRHYAVVALKNDLESEPSNEQIATGARPLIAVVQKFGTPRDFFDGWLGMEIAVGSAPLTVVALGRVRYLINPPDDPVPLGRPHMMKIVRPGAAPTDPDLDVLNAMVTVDPQSGVEVGHFRYQTLESAVDLSANTTYFVVSHETAQTPNLSEDKWHDFDTEVDSETEARVTEGVYQPDAEPGVYRPSTGGFRHTYVPVNVLYHPVA